MQTYLPESIFQPFQQPLGFSRQMLCFDTFFTGYVNIHCEMHPWGGQVSQDPFIVVSGLSEDGEGQRWICIWASREGEGAA